MTSLVDWALANALLAIPLAVAAWTSSWLRRPAISHALWVLVLLRLFAPPLWQIPLPAWDTPTPSASAVAVHESGEFPVEPIVRLAAFDGAAKPLDAAPVPVRPVSNVPAAAASPDWRRVFGGIWMAGALSCLTLAMVRAFRFQRMLSHAATAPAAWQRVSDRLASRIGLSRSPRVVMTHGAIAPLLWAGFGRPLLLLPAQLTQKLDGVRRAALLAHELAHLRRGDHWIRWIELTATAVYWWHPLLWWMRRGLRESEELCCDAWVVWTLPAARKAYADVLVDTVEYLSTSRSALPALASGLGEVRHLRRRVVMIMQSTAPRRLSRLGLMAGLAIALGLLSIAPSRGQDNEPRPAPRPRVDDPDAPRPAARRNEETERLRLEIRELRERLAQAERRLAEREGRSGPTRDNNPLGGEARGGGRSGDGRGVVPGTASGGGFGRGASDTRPARPDRGDRPGRDDRRPADGSVPAPPSDAPRAGGRGMPSDRPPDGSQGERRIRDLERELAALRREIAEMRREMRGPQPRTNLPPRPPVAPAGPAAPTPPQPPEPPAGDATSPPQ